MGLDTNISTMMRSDTDTLFADGTSELIIDGRTVTCTYLAPTRGTDALEEGMVASWRGVVECHLSDVGSTPSSGKLVKVDGNQYRIMSTNTDGPVLTIWLERA